MNAETTVEVGLVAPPGHKRKAEEFRVNFIEERRSGIGASDAAALMNVGWGCRRKLWYEKRNQEPDYPEPERPEFARGNALERIVLEMLDGQAVPGRGACVRYPEHDEILCHVDGWLGSVPVEIKVLGRESFYRTKREGLRDEYILQVQYALMVTNAPAMLVAVFWPDGWQLLPPFEVQAEPAMGEQLRVAALDFWRQVENGPAPDPLPEIDRRCQQCCYRRTCRGEELLALTKTEPEDGLVQIDSLEPLVSAYQEAREIADEATDHKDRCADKLREALDKHTACETPGWRVYYRPQERRAWDGRQLDAWAKTFSENVKNWSRSDELDARSWQHVAMALQDLVRTLTLAKRTSHSRPLRIYPT